MKSKRFFPYLLLSGKRCIRMLPFVLALSLLLTGLMLLLGNAVAGTNAETENNKKIQVGAVGDFENDYLRLGLYAVQNIDSSRFSLEVVSYDSEKEAAKALRNGKLHAYFVVPDGFGEALYEGRVLPISYVATEGSVGLGAMLIDELVESISKLVMTTQSNVFGTQNYLMKAGHENPYGAGDRLAEEYIGEILSREKLFDVRLVGVQRGLSFGEYYLCALTVLFLLLWGVACAPVYLKKNISLKRVLSAAGLSAPLQVLAEYAAYALLMIIDLACMGLAVFLALRFLFPEGMALLQIDASSLGRCLLASVLPALSLCALQQMLYEVSNGAVSSMLIQFVVAVSMGYICGCFYPSWTLPRTLQTLGSVLPAGAAERHIGNAITGVKHPAAAAVLIGYLGIFLMLTCLARKQTLKGAKGGGGE